MQDYGDALKIVKVEADPCPNLVEKYKVLPLAPCIGAAALAKFSAS